MVVVQGVELFSVPQCGCSWKASSSPEIAVSSLMAMCPCNSFKKTLDIQMRIKHAQSYLSIELNCLMYCGTPYNASRKNINTA
jgi:hypothetical protein